ncbi:MAG TPA: isocitrate lyase/phosphoenolpyruvate mutase family protein [Candidatus Binatia bacterium]|nr:isocitrate lyase/phosphoenolpyruvate mutase family protein [Candidatus Binatia bacterium]
MNDQQKRARLRELLRDPNGAIAPGVTDALFARLAQDCGFYALHLSGNAIHKNFCLPDRNLLTTTQVAQRIGQISEATDIPLIVDGGSICAETIALTRAVKLYERAGAAAVRFEDAAVNEYGTAPEELTIAPMSSVVGQIKAVVDARRDPSLVIIARCDSRPKESLDQVCQRMTAYAAAGADAVGVQLTDIADFRHVGASIGTPIVTLWPKGQVTAAEFFALGFSIALTPSSIPLAATHAAREMLLELNRQGNDREYFRRQKEFAATEKWYKQVGTNRS